MQQAGLAVLRGLGIFFLWLGRGLITCTRVLIEELVRGVFGLIRPILPWVSAAAGMLVLWNVNQGAAEAILTLIVVGLVLKMMFSRPKNKK